MATKNRMTWQYIAGFFDGEDSLSCVRNKDSNNNCWRVRLHQSSLEVLERINSFLTTNEILCTIQRTACKGHKQKHGPYRANSDMFALQISTRRKEIVPFLERILPYLIVKRILVQDLLRFLKIYPKLHRSTHGL